VGGSEREPWLTLRQLSWDRPRPPKRAEGRVVPEPGRPRGPVSGEAINALVKAMQWADEIESGLMTRAEIADREGVSRARVTQIMRLLQLGQDERDALLSGAKVCSVRQAIAAASVPRS
jgi:hypothetical protein